MVKTKFVSFKKIEGTPYHVEQGFKNNEIPYNAVRGGNGTFLCTGTPPKLNVTLKNIDSDEYYTFDVRDQLKSIYAKLTARRVNNFICNLSYAEQIMYDETSGYIIDIHRYL